MTSNENTRRPEPLLEDVQADPPPEGSDGGRPLRWRVR
jgi:hypothetical protein